MCRWASATTRWAPPSLLAAIALGACVIEKHFTLDKDMAGWDHAISADPGELRTIVRGGAGTSSSALGSTQPHR